MHTSIEELLLLLLLHQVVGWVTIYNKLMFVSSNSSSSLLLGREMTSSLYRTLYSAQLSDCVLVGHVASTTFIPSDSSSPSLRGLFARSYNLRLIASSSSSCYCYGLICFTVFYHGVMDILIKLKCACRNTWNK